jgi:hypothetical protein
MANQRISFLFVYNKTAQLIQKRIQRCRTVFRTRGGRLRRFLESPTVKEAFHWKYSSVLIFFLWSMVFAMAGLGLAVEPFRYLFTLARLLAVLAFMWSVCFWLTSEELENKKHQRSYFFWKWGFAFFIVSAFAGSIMLVNKIEIGRELSLYEGFLWPANDPDPPSFCSPDPKAAALKIFIGRNEAFATRFPFVVLRVRNKDRIIIDRDEAGRIALSADILDKDGQVIATFERGHFTLVQSNILDRKRDRSTLIVRDKYKNEVLNVRFLNKNSIQFSGLLRYPEYGEIQIPKSSAIDGICAGYSHIAFDVE